MNQVHAYCTPSTDVVDKWRDYESMENSASYYTNEHEGKVHIGGGYAENEVEMKTVIEFMIPPETPTLPHIYSYFDGCAE